MFFCYNLLDLSWEEAINNLATRLEILSYALLPILSSEVIDLAGLLENSAVVPVDQLNCGKNNDFIITLLPKV